MAASDAVAEIPPEAQVLNTIIGKFNTLLLYTVAELGIADLLKDGPKRVDELTSDAGAHPAMLYRVLRALAFQGVFAERGLKEFELTPAAETAASRSPLSPSSGGLHCSSGPVLSGVDGLAVEGVQDTGAEGGEAGRVAS